MLYTPTQALRHLRALATTSVPNCVNLDAIERVIEQTTLSDVSTEQALNLLKKSLSDFQHFQCSVAEFIDKIEQAAQLLKGTFVLELPVGIVAVAASSKPPCSPLSCDGCEKCDDFNAAHCPDCDAYQPNEPICLECGCILSVEN